MSTSVNYVGDFREELHSIGSAQGTVPIVVWTPRVPAQRAQDGETHVRGSRVHAVMAANSDAANARAVSLLRAVALTKADGAQGLTIATTTSITRTAGSFVTDGWRVGDRLMVAGATTLGNRALVRVSGVTATTLTLGTALAATEAIPAGAELQRVVPLCRPVSLAASQGYSVNSTPTSLLHPDYCPALADRPDTCIVLGPQGRLVALLDAAAAAGQAVDLWCEGGDY